MQFIAGLLVGIGLVYTNLSHGGWGLAVMALGVLVAFVFFPKRSG